MYVCCCCCCLATAPAMHRTSQQRPTIRTIYLQPQHNLRHRSPARIHHLIIADESHPAHRSRRPCALSICGAVEDLCAATGDSNCHGKRRLRHSEVCVPMHSRHHCLPIGRRLGQCLGAWHPPATPHRFLHECVFCTRGPRHVPGRHIADCR